MVFGEPTATQVFVHRITRVTLPRSRDAHLAGETVRVSPTRPGSAEIRGRAVQRGPASAAVDMNVGGTGPSPGLVAVEPP